MHELPADAPRSLFEAFGYIAALHAPSVDDLKVMVMLEAAGKRLYEEIADQASDPEVQKLLRHNGREELAHAHRISRAIGKLTGADYPVPEPDENPYLIDYRDNSGAGAERLSGLAETEYGGKELYERWAANCPNAEAAALMRQNASEESQHGDRLKQAVKILEGAA